MPAVLLSRNQKKAWIWSFCSLAVMLLIFWFSAQDGEHSSAQSGVFAAVLAHFLPMDTASFLVRKAAHFTIYFVLGFCVLRAAHYWQISPRYCLLAAWLLCTLYAGSDEFHQLFSAGRAGQITDVLLDSCGSLMGVFLSRLLLSYK